MSVLLLKIDTDVIRHTGCPIKGIDKNFISDLFIISQVFNFFGFSGS